MPLHKPNQIYFIYPKLEEERVHAFLYDNFYTNSWIIKFKLL